MLVKDHNSLSSITNQIATDTVIPAKVETKTELVQHIKTESVSLTDDIPIFSDEIIQTNAEDKSKGECQSMEDTTSLQNTANINNSKLYQTQSLKGTLVNHEQC